MKIDRISRIGYSVALLLGMSLCTGAYAQVKDASKSSQSTQQTRTYSGTVVDENDEPLIGVTVLVKGQEIGTTTDLDGNFKLQAPINATLTFSYVGYSSKEIKAPRSGQINVQLTTDNQLLDDVVVVGYATQRVKDLTGSATNVKMDEVFDLPGASLVDALAGQVVGLSVSQSSGRPGSVGSFRIRQPMSFDSSASFNQPLIVIDGVVQVDENGEPTMTQFNMLDQSEIETMTVLKDASAAVYGARASAGVILVQTKRGQKGTARISYSAKLDFQDAVGHSKMMSAYDLGVWTNRMFRQIDTNLNTTDYIPYSYSAQELERMKGLNYDWVDEGWDAALSHRHSLSVSGGSEKATYFASMNYQNQDTNLGKVQDFSKWTFRTGGDINVAAGLKLSASVSAYNTDKTENNGASDYSTLRTMPSYIPITTNVLNPETGLMEEFYTSPWAGPKTLSTHTDASVGKNYPIQNFFAQEASKARRFTKANGYNANFSAKYDVPFIKGLQLSATYAISYNNSTNSAQGGYYKVARATDTNLDGRHLLSDNTVYDFLNYGDPNGEDNSKKPAVSYQKSTSRSEQMNFMISYARQFGKHDVSATAVVERGESEGDVLSTYYQGMGQAYNGTSPTAGTLSSDGGQTYYKKYESGSLSYIGRANYKYADRYLAQFIFRADASTKFSPENYWGFFPTVSFGWVASEEKFFKNSALGNIFDYFKIRYSIGKTGKDNVNAWQWLQIYNISPTSGLGFGSIGGVNTSGATINGTANRDIRWDTTIKNNIGIDFNVLDGRLSVTTDFYYDKTKDLIMVVADTSTPIYIGTKLPSTNYGKKNAWGWEISARWHDKIQQSILPKWGPIKYSIGMDYSISWNKTILGNEPTFDYPGYLAGQTQYTGYRSWVDNDIYGFRTWKHTSGGDGILRTQQDIDNYWAYLTELATAAGTTPDYLGISSKELMYVGMLAYEDIAGDIDTEGKTIDGPNGRISTDHAQDFTKLRGSRTHGINTKLNISWGNFSISTMINTSWGGAKWLYYKPDGVGGFITNQLSFINDMFDPEENPRGKFPSLAVNNAWNQYSDFWLLPTFRMYVRNLSLSYSVPKDILRKINIQALSFTLTGNNLWDFYNPYPDHSVNNYDGLQAGYPTLRTWTISANLTF